MLSQKQIKARIKSLTEHSTNRLYREDLLDKEVDENLLLFNTRCEQCNKEPDKMIALIIEKMKGWPNMAFCQALTYSFGLKGYTSHGLHGWQAPAKIKRRNKS